MCVPTTQVCRPLRRGQTQGGFGMCGGSSKFLFAWEGWVARPVARSQDFHERVPTSGHLGGTAFLCSLCSSLLGVLQARVMIIYTTTVHTKTVFRLPRRYL